MALSQRIIDAATRQAEAFNVEPAKALAFVEVESNGQAFDKVAGQDRALIRYEGHYVWRRLPQSLREEARAQGLAAPSVGGVKNPRGQAERYALLERAVQFFQANGLDADLPYECVSVGLGQVMGANWKALGYSSALSMVADAYDETPSKDVEDQVSMVFRFLEANGLLDDLVRGNWSRLAYGYNGPAYARNSYDVRLKEAYEAWHARLDPTGESLPTLRLRSKGPAVQHLQDILRKLAMTTSKADGAFGSKTRDGVIAFQKSLGLKPDGIVGPKTWEALKRASALFK